MVSFPAVGRMGNFLFECGTALSYSLKHNLDFTVPFTTTDKYWSPIYLKHLQNDKWNPNLQKIDIWENGHQWQELPFEESWRDKNIIIQGYRQSYKYIDEHRSEILYAFNFPYELKEICSIHARYGDYVHLKEKHILLNDEYILEAMNIVKNKTGISRFKIFSDDINLFKKNFSHLYDFEYSTNTNEVDDLVEMSCCHSNINSSSTFSWWASWLNRNEEKVICTPKDWFVRGWMNMDTSDIIPPEWIKI